MSLDISQKKNILIIILTIFLLISILTFLTYARYNSNLKKAIVINEFSRITKEWRNFNFFLKELDENTLINLNDKYILLFMNLANPSEPSIPNTSEIFTSEYSNFFSEFDRLYSNIVKLFIAKLPKMSKSELNKIQQNMTKAYNIFTDMKKWQITSINKESRTISLDFPKDKLMEVIGILKKVENELYKLE